MEVYKSAKGGEDVGRVVAIRLEQDEIPYVRNILSAIRRGVVVRRQEVNDDRRNLTAMCGAANTCLNNLMKSSYSLGHVTLVGEDVAHVASAVSDAAKTMPRIPESIKNPATRQITTSHEELLLTLDATVYLNNCTAEAKIGTLDL